MSQKIISFHYKLTVADGKILDSSEGREPMTFLTEGEQIIPGLEKELLALKVGEKKKVKGLVEETAKKKKKKRPS